MAIVDQYGNEFQQDILHEHQTSSLIHLQRQVAEHPAKGITPARLNEILTAAESGDLVAQHADAPVDRHPFLLDQPVGLAAGAVAAVGQVFVQPFLRNIIIHRSICLAFAVDALPFP